MGLFDCNDSTKTAKAFNRKEREGKPQGREEKPVSLRPWGFPSRPLRLKALALFSHAKIVLR
jgi:hypothetical protein